ncbi:MAG: DUF4416 family protein [Pirellulaceae bacterium]|nr:DUF4416 family protein [Pirellulaceae bacterium]
MGSIKPPKPALLVMPMFSQGVEALEWGFAQAVEAFGPAALSSDDFDFDETAYYQKTMGKGLKLRILAFEHLIRPDQIIPIKHLTNNWEEAYQIRSGASKRSLNLDPGYMDESKFVLATTKDNCHRLYLGEGVYAEITLNYEHREWQAHPWTYPNYRRDDYHQFFTKCRNYFREQLADIRPSRKDISKSSH